MLIAKNSRRARSISTWRCAVWTAMSVGLASAAPPATSPAATSDHAARAALLSQALNFTETTSNCPANAFETPGQAWRVRLTGGSVTLDAAQYGLEARPAAFEQLYGFSPTQLGQKKGAGEILIIDHFTPIPVRVTGRTGEETLELSHGALVEAHMRSILESAGFTLASAQAGKGLLYQRGAQAIKLQRLDLTELGYRPRSQASSQNRAVTSQDLTNALEERLSQRTRGPGGPPDLVLNMSFSMIPCQPFTTYLTIRDQWAKATPQKPYTFNTFIQDVAQATNQSLAAVQKKLTDVPDSDPLRKLLAEQFQQRSSQGKHLSAVASSGNFGLPYATAPGSFGNVISVGATRWNGQPAGQAGEDAWSNLADAYAPGEWLTLTGEQLQRFCREGGTCITEDVLSTPSRYSSFGYRGTSFTAPTVSLFLALQQQPANACFISQGTGYRLLNKRTAQAKVGKSDFAQMWKTCERPPAR